MSEIAVHAQNLSKRYRIGQRKRYRTLRDSLADALSAPFRALTSVGRQAGNSRSSNDIIWALKDVSLEIKSGEVVGIIGRNGSGKTTLLKILSRITEPTRGYAEIHGRVGSLLEVGTGFHPELTGRENIYLNGAILGMKKTEIERKFDEIVTFSEVDKFIDTPVKHYSSGMFVRLAFAVAAHLEPQILIVDEVLAVGDNAFQKKCLGKMDDVAQEGRTVLIVSHNMGMIRLLCKRTILLSNGQVELEGDPDRVIAHYLQASSEVDKGQIEWQREDAAPGSNDFKLRSIRLIGPLGKPQGTFGLDQPICVEITYHIRRPTRGMRLILGLVTQEGVLALQSTDHVTRNESVLLPGYYRSHCTIPGKLLNHGRYHVNVGAGVPGVKKLIPGREWLSFTVEGCGSHGSYFPEDWPGVIAPPLTWKTDLRIETEEELSATGPVVPEEGPN
jgi:lipopolysaccharide transport system ATP-binding protein